MKLLPLVIWKQFWRFLIPRLSGSRTRDSRGGGTYIGAETVIKDVFGPFRVEWESWEAIVSHWLDAGESVVALGEYRGVNKATGKSMQSAFAHVYWIQDRRIVRFQQYTDTLMVAQAMNHDPV